MSASLEVRREFPVRRGLSVRIADALAGRSAAARAIGALHVFHRDPERPEPEPERTAPVFAAMLHALEPAPALVVADRYLRLFGERAAESGHAAARKSGTSCFRAREGAADLQWLLEEFVTEPPSIFFGGDLEHPSGAALHRLSALLPRVRFLCEPALFRGHVSLYFHAEARGAELIRGIEAFAAARGLGFALRE